MDTRIPVKHIHVPPDPYDEIFISQAFRVGNLVVTSGQAADPTDGALPKEFRVQADQTFANLARVLEAAGSCLANVIKVTIFVTDMSNYPTILELRQKYFSEPYPADSILEVSALAQAECQIEIEAIAVVSDPDDSGR